MPLHFKYTISRIIPVLSCVALALLLTACTSSIVVTPIVTPTSVPTLIPAIGTRTAQASVTVTDTAVITITPFTSQPEFGCFNNLTLPKQTGRIIWPNALKVYADSTCQQAIMPEGNRGSASLIATLPAPTGQGEVKYSMAWNGESPVSHPFHGQKIAFTVEMQKYVELTLPTTFAKGQCLQIKVPVNTYHIAWKPDSILFQDKTCSSNGVPYQLINGQVHDIMAEPTTNESDYAILKN